MHRLRKLTCGCWGKGIVREFKGHVHTGLFKMDKSTKAYCIADGTLLNAMCQPEWQGWW